MTEPASIRQSDLKRMAAVAKSEGVRIEVVIGGKIFRVMPDIPVIHSDSATRPRKDLDF